MDSRVPDVRFLLDYLIGAGLPGAGIPADRTRIGIVGHSFGGWTALATPEVELAIRAVARRFLDGNVEAELAARGVEAIAHKG